jgi:hypothetical protein
MAPQQPAQYYIPPNRIVSPAVSDVNAHVPSITAMTE